VRENPFEVLRLSPEATEEEVVRRAGDLRQTASSEEELSAVRQAVQALTGRTEDRLLQALLTHPRPVHECPALERLVALFARVPQTVLSGPKAPPPELDLEEWAALVGTLLIKELEPEPLPFELPPVEETEEEIRRQTLEALWHLLPFEPLG
jgi:hypothetical protein